MRITKRHLRRIIKEEKANLLKEMQMDKVDEQLQIAMELFGPETLVDEEMGEIVIDVGDDQMVEDMYDQWISYWPDGMMEEGGRIYTGLQV